MKYSADSTDDELMQAYAAGAAQAFDILYQRYRGLLYSFLKRQLADGSRVDELYQDVWMKVITQAGNYQAQGQFKAWLMRIAHNALMDHFRRQPSQPVVELEEDEVLQLHSPLREPATEHAWQNQLARLRRAIGELPEEQREAFLLKEEAGLSLEQIAEVMRTGRETIKSRLRYAINRLRGVLAEVET